jgi:hypothetical protein
MKAHKLSLLLALALLTPAPVLAQTAPTITYNGASSYLDSAGNFYRVGLTPGSDFVYQYNGVVVSQSRYSDACGFLRLSIPQSVRSFSVNGTAVTLTTAMGRAADTSYRCTDGVAQWKGMSAQTGVFYIAGREAKDDRVYLPAAISGGANRMSKIDYTANLAKAVRVNGCGFVRLPMVANSRLGSSTSLFVGYGYNAESVASMNLASNPNPPDCVGGKLYVQSANSNLNGGTVALYRTSNAVYYAGLTPGSLNVVNVEAMASKSVGQDRGNCGLFKVETSNPAPTTIKIGGQSYSYAALAIKSANCGNVATLTVNTPYSGGGGTVYYRSSDNSLKRLAIEYSSQRSANIPVNQCGFTRIDSPNRANGFTAGDKVVINGSAPYDVMAIPVGNAPLCKGGVGYTTN